MTFLLPFFSFFFANIYLSFVSEMQTKYILGLVLSCALLQGKATATVKF